jgi:dolichol-phosphate mannosyltransferase
MKVIVVVPTFNEAQMITKTIEVLQGIACDLVPDCLEVLVVDSMSPDGTAEIVRKLQARWSGLHLLLESKRSGLGGAYLLGMRFAVLQLQADVLISFDADLSHDATQIPLMLKRVFQGDDMVIGTRYAGSFGQVNWVWYRYLFSKFSNQLICFVLGFSHISDWTGGFRCCKKEVFLELEFVLLPFKNYAFQIVFLHQALLKKKIVSEVSYQFVNRQVGHSKISIRDTWGFCRYLLFDRFSIKL